MTRVGVKIKGGLGGGLTKDEADLLYHPLKGREDVEITVEKEFFAVNDGDPRVPDEAHLEVISRDNVLWLHSTLPFYSDYAVVAGGISNDSGGGGGTSYLSGLNDVQLTNVSDGQVLVYDGSLTAPKRWKNKTLSPTDIYAGLTGTPTDGQTIVWDSGNNKWKYGNAGGGISTVATYNTLGGVKPAYSNTGAATFGTTPASVSNSVSVQARSTESNRYYVVEIDNAGRLYVNVPWAQPGNVSELNAGTSTAYRVWSANDLDTWLSGKGYITTNSTYRLSINGITRGDSTHGTDLGSIYAPTGSGASGQYLRSRGSNTDPEWVSTGQISSGSTSLVQSGTIYAYIHGKFPQTGNTGVPVFINSNEAVQVITYLNIGTEQGSIILPFFTNDIAFLQSRGGSCTISGVTNSPDLTALFNGKPDYTFLTVGSTSNTVTITIVLPTDTIYNYGERFYIDFGSTAWRAQHIEVIHYIRPTSSSDPSADTEVTPHTIIENNELSFWTPGQLPIAGENKLTKIVVKLKNFTRSDPRISEIGVQRYTSQGLSASYMSRGMDDPVYRSITPNSDVRYSLGASGKNWKMIRAEDHYAKSFISWRKQGEQYTDSSGNPATADGGFNFYTVTSEGTWREALRLSTNEAVVGTGSTYVHFRPGRAGVLNLGSTEFPWQDLYLRTSFRIFSSNNSSGTEVLSYGSPNLKLGYGYATSDYLNLYGYSIRLYPNSTSSAVLTVESDKVTSTQKVMPLSDNSISLGTGSYRWKELHAAAWYPVLDDSSRYMNYETSGTLKYFRIHNCGLVVDNFIVAGGLTSAGGDIAITSSLIPTANNQYDLGSADYYFKDVYATNIGIGGEPVSHVYADNVEAGNLTVTGTFSYTEPMYEPTGQNQSYVNDALDSTSGTSVNYIQDVFTTSRITEFTNGIYKGLKTNKYNLKFTGWKVESSYYTLCFGSYLFRQTGSTSWIIIHL